MQLSGLELSGPAISTAYAEVRTGRRIADGAPVGVERLRATDADVRERLLPSAAQARDALRRLSGLPVANPAAPARRPGKWRSRPLDPTRRSPHPA